ncbi:MAG: hypothetical protein H6751_18660 [Candidatus Omnitrophica bacterium]|nr:hypothetical protein [Candidatus Omnitrophota bacterium]MCB9784999.1 hypothetical protein [Candidatus Omnitrophota bacterium]
MSSAREGYHGYLCGACDQPIDKKERVCPHCGIRFNPLMGFKVYHDLHYVWCTKIFYSLGLLLFFLLVVLVFLLF